jgi:hypothetical protein
MSCLFSAQPARLADSLPATGREARPMMDVYLSTIDLYRDARLQRSQAIAAAGAEISGKVFALVKQILAAWR